MAIVKRIVCLANSRKLNGRCVAGIEISPTGERLSWVRPVSMREHEEVSEYERQYQNGADPRVLDLIDLPLLDPGPNGYQQENWLLDPAHYWTKLGQVRWADLDRLAETVAPLWINDFHTYNGLNDKIPLESADGIRTSLRLIRVGKILLSVFKPGEAFGNPKRRVQGQFTFGGTDYHLWVTDPVVERSYLAQPDGQYMLDECFLTISLGEPHNGACYKLVAAIIPKTART